MPKLSEYWANYETYTSKASDIARQLSFAGVAVIWIFRIANPDGVAIPKRILPSLALFVLALSLDLLQYVTGSVVWWAFCRHYEKEAGPEDDPNLTGPWWINLPATVPFVGKIAFTFVAYAILLAYCVSQFWG